MSSALTFSHKKSHIVFTAQFFGATIGLLSWSTVTTVFVIKIHYMGEFSTGVPPLIKQVVFKWIARAVGLKKLVEDHASENEPVISVSLSYSKYISIFHLWVIMNKYLYDWDTVII